LNCDIVFSSLSFVDSRPVIYVRRRGWGKSDDLRGNLMTLGECFMGSEGMDTTGSNIQYLIRYNVFPDIIA